MLRPNHPGAPHALPPLQNPPPVLTTKQAKQLANETHAGKYPHRSRSAKRKARAARVKARDTAWAAAMGIETE